MTESFAPLERPRVPALEAILGKPFKVLDDGFVRVVDYMGDDSAIVQAARVSYGAGTKRVSEDRGLIRYLMRHRHTTPFEMCELKLHVRVPMDAWRQWIRHRSACLTGDTMLYFDQPASESRGGRRRHNMTIADFHRLWHHGTTHPIGKKKPTFVERIDPQRHYTVPELARLVERRAESLRNMIRAGALRAIKRPARGNAPSLFVKGQAWIDWAETTAMAHVPMRERLQGMRLRMCDEVTGEIRHTTVTDIWESGVKPVFTVTLENGYRLTMSQDHRCLTEQGWMTLAEATRLKLTDDKSVTWDKSAPAFAVNGIPAHRDADWLRQQKEAGLGVTAIADRAGVSCHTIRKALKEFNLSYTAAEIAKLRGLAQRGRKRNAKGPRRYSMEGMARLKAARTGKASNFWKGGTSTERALIARWTRDHAQQTHARFGFACALCGSNDRLHAHHVDPVWHNPDRARDAANLMTLCTPCHQRLHATNLEMALLESVEHGADLRAFWQHAPTSVVRPRRKRLPKVRKLVRGWSKIARIEYAGEQPTYDLSVAGPFHNFVANGFVVHNSVNEYSTRYSVAIDAAQTTAAGEWRSQAKDNKQGSGDYLAAEVGSKLSERERELQALAREVYEERLAAGVAREQARKDLPLSTYTEAYWKIDLHNLLHFLALRMDSHAQYEIRAYAETIGREIVSQWCPLAWEAFMDYRFGGMSLSAHEQAIIAAVGKGDMAEAKRLADERGWLATDDQGQLKRNRERSELEAKLARFNLPVPWA